METEMEVDSSEIASVNKDESYSQTKPSTLIESPEIEPSVSMESSSQIVPSSQVDEASSPPVLPSNDANSPQAVPSDEGVSLPVASKQVTSSQAVPSDQTTSSQGVPSDKVASSEMPPPQVVPSSKAPSTNAESPQVLSCLPGTSSGHPSSLPSKMTNGPASKKQRLDFHSMSTGVYLDSTVVPILHLALVTLDRLRPADPVQYVIDFLLRHKAQYSKSKEQPAPSSSANQA